MFHGSTLNGQQWSLHASTTMPRASSLFKRLRRARTPSNNDVVATSDVVANSGVVVNSDAVFNNGTITPRVEVDGDEGAALMEVYRGKNPEVDIIAVHGINGDPLNTFSTKDNNRFWLGDRDMLPQNVENSRILTYRYPASVVAVFGSTSSDRILQHAHTMIAELVANRELANATTRPIIFICHSLGGIIVKRALVYSASRTARHIIHLHSIYVSTYGVLFFGTPHQGSGTANLGIFAQRIVDVLLPSRVVDTQSQLLDALKENSEVLQEITDNFVPLMKDLRVYFFWEQEKTDLGYKLDYVVTENSAAPILDNTERAGLRADHRNMCKFASRNAPGYRLVASSLVRYSRDAPQAISRRWRNENEMRRSLRQQELKNLREDDETYSQAETANTQTPSKQLASLKS
ncbi:ribonuclease-like protein p/mrp subunit [Hypoxylon argillaceum]|nr:ribonuclease-like protein p/mrp subunit [Hypoxylon argillaceum]